MQQSEYYSYLLDNNSHITNNLVHQDNTFYNNNNKNINSINNNKSDQNSSSTHIEGSDNISSSTNVAVVGGTTVTKTASEPSTSATTSSTQLKGGTDFRRRKNWSERILVEITGLLHVLSPAGKILYCSESTHELTGYRPHELVGQALTDFLHVDDMDVFIRDFQMSFHSRSQIKTHYRFRKKDESYVIFEVVGQPKSDIVGQPPQSFFGIAQPVPTKRGASIDSFLELKAENNWLKKRIEELRLKYGNVNNKSVNYSANENNNTISNENNSDQSTHINHLINSNSIQPQLYHSNVIINNTNTNTNDTIKTRLSEEWLDNGSSDIEDYMTGYPKKENLLNLVQNELQHEIPERKDKWKRRKKHKGTDEFVCTDCGTTSSPEWRKGPHGPKTLCNACGLRWAKKNKKRDLNDD